MNGIVVSLLRSVVACCFVAQLLGRVEKCILPYSGVTGGHCPDSIAASCGIPFDASHIAALPLFQGVLLNNH